MSKAGIGAGVAVIGLGTLGVVGLMLASSSSAAAAPTIKTDDLFTSEMQIPEGFPEKPTTRTRVRASSSRLYDVLGWRKNKAGVEFFIAVLLGTQPDPTQPALIPRTKGEEWLAYTRDKLSIRKFYRALAPDSQELAQLKADFGLAA